MIIRLQKDKYYREWEEYAKKFKEDDPGKDDQIKAARQFFLHWYRQCPGKLCKLPSITVEDWKYVIDEVDKDIYVGTSIKRLFVDGVSERKYTVFKFHIS